MPKLLIIADDITGALDTGVQFAQIGASVKVFVYERGNSSYFEQEVDVLVFDTETRHEKRDEAYKILWEITKKAQKYRIQYIYKKTDSVLRGNIGSELSAVIEANEKYNELMFVPAFPKMNRITVDGVQLVDGIEVAESSFGKDPFDPVKKSYIPDIIGIQSSICVLTEKQYTKDIIKENKKKIVVYDGITEKQIKEIGKKLFLQDKLHVMAGCAGFAAYLPQRLGFEKKITEKPSLKPAFLVICGSMNPTTVKQIRHGKEVGFKRIQLTSEQKYDWKYCKSEQGEEQLRIWINLLKENERCILDCNEETVEEPDFQAENVQKTKDIGEKVAKSIGCMLKALMEAGMDSTIMITGGDTLMGFLKNVSVSEITPLIEILPGVVLSTYLIGEKKYQIISKSGGFGDADILEKLAKVILSEREITRNEAV